MNTRLYRDEDWLRQKYVAEELSASEIAEECPSKPCAATVSNWINRFSMEREHLHRDPDWLYEKRVEENLTQVEIAEIAGVSDGTICRMLNKHNIQKPTPKHEQEDWLREKYIKEHLKASEISELCDVSKTTIIDRLNKFNIEVRDHTDYLDSAVYRDEKWLREKYVDEELSTTQIADLCPSSPSANTISYWLNKHEIERERLHDDYDWLYEQYYTNGHSGPEIADMAEVATTTIYTALKKHDIPEPERKYTDEDWLRQKYVNESLSTRKIATLCDARFTTILRWLHEFSISVSEPGGQRGTKIYHDEDWLQEQYVEQGKSAGQIADENNCSSAVILRWLSMYNIERREPWDYIPESERVRAGPEYQKWLDRVHSRGECESCGRKEYLEAHHPKSVLEHPEVASDLENSQLLCAWCHASEHPEMSEKMFTAKWDIPSDEAN